jgi:hypothetical protein
MELTKEYLVDLREKAVAKRQEYINMIHQADGAIGVIDLMLSQLQGPVSSGEQGEEK